LVVGAIPTGVIIKEGAMKDAVIVEIRSGEGGLHSKFLVNKFVGIYVKYGIRRGL
jgi:protein subunit release factor A